MVDEEIEMTWVDELPEVERIRDSAFDKFVQQLQTRPNTWAVFRVMPEGRLWTSTSAYTRNYPDNLIFSQRKVDGKNVVYVQWVTTDLYSLGLNTRITNCLRRLGCKEIDDVCQYSRSDLLFLNNMGEKSVDDLERKLLAVGRSLSTVDHSTDEMYERQWARFRQGLDHG